MGRARRIRRILAAFVLVAVWASAEHAVAGEKPGKKALQGLQTQVAEASLATADPDASADAQAILSYLEGLPQRAEHRYPDQGMSSRFLEMGTELPPLFGEEF